MSWNASRARDDALEGQNDELLGELHRKVKQLHSVTLDIHDDARGQNTLIDSTVRPLSSAGGAGSSGALQSQTFDNFKSSLGNSANRLARSVAKQGQPRIVAYCVGLLVVLMLVWRYIL